MSYLIKRKIIKLISVTSCMMVTLLSQAYAIDVIVGGGEIGVNPVDNNFASKILGAVQFVGYAIAIGMLITLGAKYTMASADDKASLKSSIPKYILGAILIAGAATVAGWIFNLI